ncbi:MAG: metallophosphoesterase [Magnetococcus sp. MYC-9]
MENALTAWVQQIPAHQAEWDSSRLWKRIRAGFQEILRHLRAGELPATPPTSTLPVVPPVAHPPPATDTTAQPLVTPAQPTRFPWTVVLSDTDNDFHPVLQSLRLAGLCDQHGCWVPGLQNIQVVHTGDWLNKWDPNPHVLDGFKRLQATIPEGCRLILLNGNHELSILQMADQGLRTPLTREDLAFIRRQHLLHIDHGTLFLHGYPGSDLLMILKQFQREEVNREEFHERLHAVFFAGQFPLFREARSLRIIGDIKNPKFYYNQRSSNGIHRGEQIAAILQDLGLTTLIHGHKPGSEVQTDYELQAEVPGIRFINNDNRARQTGWGGMLVGGQGEIHFINPQTLHAAGGEKGLGKRLRRLLKTRRRDLHRPPQHTEEVRIAA